MARVTQSTLEGAVLRINTIMLVPKEPYKMVEGRGMHQVGCYYLSEQYGGYRLERIVEGGASNNVLNIGHISKTKLLDLLYAYIAGLIDAGM